MKPSPTASLTGPVEADGPAVGGGGAEAPADGGAGVGSLPALQATTSRPMTSDTTRGRERDDTGTSWVG